MTTTLIEAAMETVRGQARNAGMEVTSELELNYLEGSFFIVSSKGVLKCLLVLASNIKRCMSNHRAVWHTSQSLKDYDAVLVFYGESRSVEATWEESAGNKNMDDYRRLSRVKDVVKAPHDWRNDEIDTNSQRPTCRGWFSGRNCDDCPDSRYVRVG